MDPVNELRERIRKGEFDQSAPMPDRPVRPVKPKTDAFPDPASLQEAMEAHRAELKRHRADATKYRRAFKAWNSEEWRLFEEFQAALEVAFDMREKSFRVREDVFMAAWDARPHKELKDYLFVVDAYAKEVAQLRKA